MRQIQLAEQRHAFLALAEDWKILATKMKKLSQIQHRENLRIAITHTIASAFFCDVLKLFSSRALPVYLHVTTSSSKDSLHKIQNDETDFARTGNTISWMNVVTESVARERIVFVSGINSPYGDHVKVSDLNPDNEVYINWGHNQLLWHQYHFGADFMPLLRLESVSVAEAFLNETAPQMWAPMAYSAAKAMLPHNRIKISELDHQIPHREIFLVSRIPVKQPYHDMLLEDINTVLKGHDELTTTAS